MLQESLESWKNLHFEQLCHQNPRFEEGHLRGGRFGVLVCQTLENHSDNHGGGEGCFN